MQNVAFVKFFVNHIFVRFSEVLLYMYINFSLNETLKNIHVWWSFWQVIALLPNDCLSAAAVFSIITHTQGGNSMCAQLAEQNFSMEEKWFAWMPGWLLLNAAEQFSENLM